MLLRPIKWLIGAAGLVALSYGCLFVPLGSYTPYEHALRVAETAEAQEFGTELREAASTAFHHLAGLATGLPWGNPASHRSL